MSCRPGKTEEMPSSYRMVLLLLLLLLLLWTGTQAQSGDRDADTESRISCTADISVVRNILTCELLGGPNHNEDDEDSESDDIARMSVCYTDYAAKAQTKCEESLGNTISPKMPLVSDFNLTTHLKRGGSISATLNLQKIVKPRRPFVQDVDFNLDSKQAVIYIQTPYHNDYLKIENQLFQLHICTAMSQMTQNVSASDHMKIDMQSLQRDAEHRVKVRALPIKLQGSWSEWSDTFSFTSPTEVHQEGYILLVCLVSLLVVMVSAGFLWKNKIFTYMWPSIPHPKRTLVQICKPNKGLLLNFSPEVFSALKVYPMEAAGEETEPSLAPAAVDSSSDCRSTSTGSTEELELSRSSDGEESVLPLWDTHTPQAQQEEAYVTMSSFYQNK